MDNNKKRFLSSKSAY